MASAQFATSARAVDMLGRQQIATVPTAISELFKNAYDAYARRVRADYFPQRRALLLRDDGVGMSRAEFLDRWLVLGTDSKAVDSSRPRPPRPDGMPARPTMGEKGIGRLAIGSLGPQVVVVTRPHLPVLGPRPVVVALVQWTMFEIPGLLLGDVDVPMMEIEEGWPDQSQLDSLGQQVVANLDRLRARVPVHFRETILDQVSRLRAASDHDLGEGPSLGGGGHGTHFLVAPVHEELEAALSPKDAAGATKTSDFERLLIGFSDTMLPDAPKFPMSAAFIEHRPDAPPRDIIERSTFWEPEDFKLVDHDIAGEFDETGRFIGTVSVYGREPIEHVVPWPAGLSRGTRCGPFRLRLGYLQGNVKESRLDQEEFSATAAKMARIGGLYVYRDGIRVLPYGSADVDYLGIEERRTRNAGRYYFSYRRMFGAIEISTAGNPRLRDKASREGLLDNVAFREFKGILENFLVQIAADFFRSSGAGTSADFAGERARLREQDAERRRAAAALAHRRDSFDAQLQERLGDLESGRAEQRVLSTVEGLRLALVGEDQLTASILADLEADARAELRLVADSVRLDLPPGLALTDDQARDLRQLRARERSLTSHIALAADTVASTVQLYASAEVRDELATRRLEAFDRGAAAAALSVETAVAGVATAIAGLGEQTVVDAATRIGAVRQLVESLREPLAAGTSDGGAYQDGLSQVEELARQHVVDLVEMKQRLVEALDDDAAAETRLLQERLIGLESKADADVDLLLLGQAVQVIDHELEATIGRARSSLADLSRRTKGTLYRESVDVASSAFSHLDGYLRLFTPLQRRLRRQKVDLSGERIDLFVSGLFEARFADLMVVLRATRKFRLAVVHGFPSTFLPVFANLVDNAAYWAARGNPDGGGVVTMDLDEGDMVVRDNGPGVSERDADVIFSAGFTRRPDGRGLGLSISRDALAKEGWSLTVDPPSPERIGASFRIHRYNNHNHQD